MKTIIIPVEVSKDILISLNQSEQELKSRFQMAIAISLFHEGKLTLGKAIQLSGTSRYDFEKSLAKSKISVSDIDVDQVLSDVNKISKI